MQATYLPIPFESLASDQVQAILDAHLRRARGLLPNTPSGYHDLNGVPIVWDNPQAAALAWQQHVEEQRSIARHMPGYQDPVVPALQTWPNELPRPYGMLSPSADPGSGWDGYHRMGPGYSNLPAPVTAIGPRLQARRKRVPF